LPGENSPLVRQIIVTVCAFSPDVRAEVTIFRSPHPLWGRGGYVPFLGGVGVLVGTPMEILPELFWIPGKKMMTFPYLTGKKVIN
jgi:hypothetical protein